jgi:hypothetical protein
VNDAPLPPQTLGPAQPALPLADTGSTVGAVVALLFCAVALAALIIPLSRALGSWQSSDHKEVHS